MAMTEQGVAYELHFGSVFSGSEEEVEAGFIKKDDEKAEGDAARKLAEAKQSKADLIKK